MSSRAIILSAGFGTRLRPLTDELPKPLVPVGDRPLAAHIAGRLAAFGVREVVLNTHHRADKFASYIEDMGVIIHVIHEPRIRGTAGGVAGARGLFGDAPIFVWNGDILADPPLAELERAAGRGVAFSVAPRPLGEGTVGVDAAGRLVRLRGERFGVEVGGGDYIGVAALGADVLARLPVEGCLVGDVALPMLRRGEAISAVRTLTPWTDVGSLSSYRDANAAWLASVVPDGGAWVHPTAVVGPEVSLRGSVVGAGARVSGSGALERCIVWPGAEVAAPLADTVATTGGLLVSVA